MRSSCKVKQRDLTDCGVACLASVAAYYGLFIPLGKLRQHAATDKSGTTVAGLIRAAGKLSLTAKGVRAEIENLSQLPIPFIAHVIKDNMAHYVVIFKVTGRSVKLMDPADGLYHTLDSDAFRKIWSGVLVLLFPKDDFQKADNRISSYAWYLQLVRSHSGLLIQSVIAAIFYTILGLAPSFYIQKIVDHVLVDENRRLLHLMTLIMFACLLLQIAIGYLKSLFILFTGQYIDAKLILGYCRHLLKLPQSFFDNMQVGELVSRVNDAVKIRSFINNTGIDMLLNVFIICFSIMIMLIYNWKLAILVSLIFPAYIVIYIINNYLNKKWQRRIMEKAARVETSMVETLSNIRTIKRFSLEEFMSIRIDNSVIDLLKAVFKSNYYNLYIISASEFLLRALSISMLCAGSYYVLNNQLTAGELLSFYSLLAYFTGPANSLMTANRAFQDAAIAGDRLFDIADLDHEASADGKTELSREMIGDIVFNEVQFAYGTRGYLFTRLTMTIRVGRATAIVGESGSGKSSLLSLLQNMYPIEKGSISIGGYNLKNISNESLRSIIAIVPQEIQLLSGTIIENIAIGEYEPDIKSIIELCRLLALEEFIERLPLGYNSFVGEQGMSLSGGQRQRIAIARALYRQPAILLLDEATSSLDALSEAKVQEAVSWFLARGGTVLIIAHRLSTISHCEDIKVLKEGRLIEEGTHSALMTANGYYAKMWNEKERFV